MATNFSNLDFKRYGSQRAADNADTVGLVVNPIKGDTYTAFSAKLIAQAVLTTGDWNFVAEGADLKVTVNGKSGIDPSGTALDTDDIAVAVFDAINEIVYLVQDVVDRDITNEAGDTLNIPALVFYAREVSAVV